MRPKGHFPICNPIAMNRLPLGVQKHQISGLVRRPANSGPCLPRLSHNPHPTTYNPRARLSYDLRPPSVKIVVAVTKVPFLVALSVFPAAYARPQQAGPPESAPTIRQTVQEVVLDVVVRDGRGRVVKNLKPGDLEVFENGARQEIRSFRLVPGREVVMTGKSKAPVRQGAAAANPLKAINLICIVFANLDPYTKPYAVDAVREFLKSPLEPDTWVAVFNLDSQLTVLHPFTTNPNAILAAANKAFVGLTVDFAQVATAVLNATPGREE